MDLRFDLGKPVKVAEVLKIANYVGDIQDSIDDIEKEFIYSLSNPNILHEFQTTT